MSIYKLMTSTASQTYYLFFNFIDFNLQNTVSFYFIQQQVIL